MEQSTKQPSVLTNEYYQLERILTDLQKIVNRENQRHEMDQHLTPSLLSLLENEIIPVLEEEFNYDGADDYSGEPPITAAEMHAAAWKEHQEAHR